MSTKQKIKDAENRRRSRKEIYMDYFLGLLHNSITIENLPSDVPKRYFLKTLFKYGKIAHYQGGKKELYLPCYGAGRDVYGLPTQYVLFGYNGYITTEKADNIQILRINDQGNGISDYIEQQCELIADIDMSIYQNLYAVRTMSIYECADEKTLLSIQNIEKARSVGALCAFKKSGTYANGDALKVHSTNAEYLITDLQLYRKEVINETLTRIGVMTNPIEKKERVQTAEVNSNIGQTIDSIYVMIDTFNHDAKVGGLPLRMVLNSVTEDYYRLDNDGDGTPDYVKGNEDDE